VPRSRILVAISSPWAGEKLAASVRDLCERLNATAVVAHVARAREDDETDADARQRGEQTLATLIKRLADEGISAEGVILFGDDVARAILNAAKAHHVTLILLGASGKGRMARLLAGDIPAMIIRQAELPVLVFPPDWAGTV